MHPYLRRSAILLVLPLLTSCASFSQGPDDVYIRNGTDGKLAYWKPVTDTAPEHLPFVWASIAAYQKSGPKVPEGCPLNPEIVLREADWISWDEIPMLADSRNALAISMAKTHLRARVYSNRARNTVMVAFGGTENLKDLGANARWALPDSQTEKDQYHLMIKTFVPAFAKLWQEKKSLPAFAWIESASLISTGHSLGGGLAQGFSYAAYGQGLPIRRAIVFNSSPVSGKHDVDRYQEFARHINVERIYNRGEILAGLRATINTLSTPSVDDATFTDIRYAIGWKWYTPLTLGMIQSHFLYPLACTLTEKVKLRTTSSALSENRNGS